MVRRQAKCGDDRRVGGRHRDDLDLGQGRPAQRMAFPCTGFATPFRHTQCVQANGLFRVTPWQRNQRFGPECFNVEFFVEFADQRLLDRFAGFQLAAGKFPQAGEMLARQPLHQQHATALIDEDAGGDLDHRRS